MKVGYVNALAAMLVGSSWSAAHGAAPAPAPGRVDQPGPRQTVQAPVGAPVAGPVAGPVVGPAPAYAPAGTYGGGGYVAPGGEYVGGNGTEGATEYVTYGRAPYRTYAIGEYLLYRIPDGSLPNLASRPPVGVLTVQQRDFFETTAGAPINQVVRNTGFFGTQISRAPQIPFRDFNVGEHNGFRATVGMWLDDQQDCGLEVSGFWLDRRSVGFNNLAAGDATEFIIQTPFFDRVFQVIPAQGSTPEQRILTQTLPIFFVRQANDTLFGSLTNQMWGGEITARRTLAYFGPSTFGVLGGARYMHFREDLNVQGNFNLSRPTDPANTDPAVSNLPDRLQSITRDRAALRNDFLGAQFGANYEVYLHRFFFNALGKIALGGTREQADLQGSTTTTRTATALAPASSVTSPGGILFSPLDIAQHNRYRFTVIPELNLRIGYQLLDCMRLTVGYDVLYVSNVARAGSVVATSAQSTTIQAGAAVNAITVPQNTFRFNSTDMVIEGFTLGVEISY